MQFTEVYMEETFILIYTLVSSSKSEKARIVSMARFLNFYKMETQDLRTRERDKRSHNRIARKRTQTNLNGSK